MEILTNFSGGNIELIAIEKNVIRFRPHLRDTSTDWFYWAFCVTGAAEMTLKFDLSPLKYIGYHGPAVSYDLKNWHWAGGNADFSSFTYTFAKDENCVYFAHNMLYGVEMFYEFANRLGIATDRLCVSDKGRNVPVANFGDGEEIIMLTARHHSCESTGNYVLEGVIEELYKNPIPNCRIVAVPFVDLDGVAEGDQGKNRIPHDHNRDYNDAPLYNSVRSIMNLAMKEKIRYAFDFHSPWHLYGRNDKIFIVRVNDEFMPEYVKFSELFENEANDESMKYDSAYDLNPGVEWNKRNPDEGRSFSSFFSEQPNIKLTFTIESAYFGGSDDIVSQKKLIETGKSFASALKKFEKK